MRATAILLVFLTALCSCSQKLDQPAEYPLQVGDIAFDPELDDPGFKVCDESHVFQYYNFGKGMQYKGEKIKIDDVFRRALKPSPENETGFFTIRFIVNCEGKSGRFRFLGMDNNYDPKTFDKALCDQLLHLTQQLDGWIVGEFDGNAYDYYQYLTFKIEKGKLIEIMP